MVMPAQPAMSAKLEVPAHAEEELARIATMKKFGPDGALYTGITNPERREIAESVINLTIVSIAKGLRNHPTKDFILSQFRRAMADLDLAGVVDTEDREAAAKYLEMIMDVTGLTSSDGLLNTWVYGFDPNDLTGK